MARRVSRRVLAEYVAGVIVEGGDLSLATQQLAAHLVVTRRTKELDMIMHDVAFILADKGIVSGTVVSAHELTQETKKAIQSYVADVSKAKSISLSYQLDQAVIGGYKVSLPGSQIDRTISHQLTQLKTRFKKV
jgi:F0F1-type ATP synthase delta subunit